MDFLDEKIMEMRRQEKQKELNIREDGLIVKGEKIEFQDTTLFQEKMLILLPTSFVDMPQKIARLKYPSEQRPQIIKTDLLGSTNFAFNLFDKAIQRDSAGADEIRRRWYEVDFEEGQSRQCLL